MKMDSRSSWRAMHSILLKRQTIPPQQPDDDPETREEEPEEHYWLKMQCLIVHKSIKVLFLNLLPIYNLKLTFLFCSVWKRNGDKGHFTTLPHLQHCRTVKRGKLTCLIRTASPDLQSPSNHCKWITCALSNGSQKSRAICSFEVVKKLSGLKVVFVPLADGLVSRKRSVFYCYCTLFIVCLILIYHLIFF